MITDSQFPAWLPDALSPVVARLARVDDCIGEVIDQSGRWSLNEPLELHQLRRSDGRYRVVVASVRPIPPSIAILFSEAIHHLRAVLDNVVWHLVEQEMGSVSEEAARLVGMPIYTDAARFDRRASRLRSLVPVLGEPSSLTFQRVRALQPFCDDALIGSASEVMASMLGVEPEFAHPLSLLQAYSNLDKHRAIRMSVGRATFTSPSEPLLSQDRSFRELTEGVAVSPDGTWGEPVPFESSAAVMVQRPEPWATAVSPGTEVHALRTWVRSVALPRLLTGSSEVTDPIPVTIDLGDDGRSLRERIEQPEMPSAYDRARELNMTRLTEALERPVKFPTIVDVEFDA